MKISLLCPSRSRPGKTISNLCDWFDRMTGDFDVEIILSLDSNDPQLEVYHNLNEAQDKVANIILVSENKSAVDAINAAAEIATGDILIVVSDDTDCLPSWDEALVKIVEGKEDWILKCNDGNIQSWIITMPVMDRKYYQRFGYIYQPEYEHMFCLHPDSQIYMGDYSFKRIADVKVGDSIIGTERRKGKSLREQEFLCRTLVTDVHTRVSQIYEITLASGRIVRSTIDHKWGYYDGSRAIRYGVPKIGRRLKRILDLPGQPPIGLDFERGWLSGMWDGEGSFDVLTQSTNHNMMVCEEIERIMNLVGFRYSITHQKSKIYKGAEQRIFTLNGGRNEYIKMLNWLRPVKRVTPRADKRLLSARYGDPDEIVGIRAIGEGDVYCITTGTKNFIADGYLSHNCDTELTAIADLLGKKIECDLLFKHNHYSVTGGIEDSVTEKANATWNQGEALFLSRVKRNFDLIDPTGQIKSEEYLAWISSKV